MSFGKRLRDRREELCISREDLAESLGVTRSAIGNYETSVSAPKEEVLLRLFDILRVDPNYLYQDSFRAKDFILSPAERTLVEQYRRLSPSGQHTARSVTDALVNYQVELEQEYPERDLRYIPLYRSPAAAGYAAPVFGEDYDSIPLTPDLPQGAEFAVRIQGDSMSPWIEDGSVAYANRDPLSDGDVGIFCVDGDMLCKQYHRRGGVAYLFSLNRKRKDADVVLTPNSGRSLVCFGRVMLHSVPLPKDIQQV